MTTNNRVYGLRGGRLRSIYDVVAVADVFVAVV